MTDIMSETYGREIVARTAFKKEAVWLPLLAVHQLNVGDPVVRGKTFTDCVIEGPALMVSTGDVVFEGCNLGVAADPRSLLYKPQGPVLVGAIAFADCRFVRCRFVQVGFTGPDAFLDDLAKGLTSMRDDQT